MHLTVSGQTLIRVPILVDTRSFTTIIYPRQRDGSSLIVCFMKYSSTSVACTKYNKSKTWYCKTVPLSCKRDVRWLLESSMQSGSRACFAHPSLQPTNIWQTMSDRSDTSTPPTFTRLKIFSRIFTIRRR